MKIQKKTIIKVSQFILYRKLINQPRTEYCFLIYFLAMLNVIQYNRTHNTCKMKYFLFIIANIFVKFTFISSELLVSLVSYIKVYDVSFAVTLFIELVAHFWIQFNYFMYFSINILRHSY